MAKLPRQPSETLHNNKVVFVTSSVFNMAVTRDSRASGADIYGVILMETSDDCKFMRHKELFAKLLKVGFVCENCYVTALNFTGKCVDPCVFVCKRMNTAGSAPDVSFNVIYEDEPCITCAFVTTFMIIVWIYVVIFENKIFLSRKEAICSGNIIFAPLSFCRIVMKKFTRILECYYN